MGPLLGILKPTGPMMGPLRPMGPLKSMNPGVIVPSAPPLGDPGQPIKVYSGYLITNLPLILICTHQLHLRSSEGKILLKIIWYFLLTKICSRLSRRVARNSQWGWAVWGAGSQWGSVGEAPSRRRLEVWGQSPQPPEARGFGGEAPSARKFCIFLQK